MEELHWEDMRCMAKLAIRHTGKETPREEEVI
jgi:hypothetical protein